MREFSLAMSVGGRGATAAMFMFFYGIFNLIVTSAGFFGLKASIGFSIGICIMILSV